MNTPKSRRWIVLAVIGMAALGARPESDAEKIRRLVAENRLLKAQVASLKRKLATRKPGAASGPASKPTQPPPGVKILSVAVKESDPTWWTDLSAFTKEIQARQSVGTSFPKESLAAWAGRHKSFISSALAWKMRVMKVRHYSESDAGREYYQAMSAVKEWRTKLNQILKAKGRSADLKRIRDTRRQMLAEAEDNMAIFGAMKDKGGGAKITARDDTKAVLPVVVVDVVQMGKVDLQKGGTMTARGTVVDAQVQGGPRTHYGLLRFRLKS